MKDYSQFGEQQYILEVLKDIKHGKLLDIGAWDPIDKSNSRALLEMGWKGVLFEPSPGPLKNLITEYGSRASSVEVVAGAVTGDGGFIKLTVTDDALSSDINNSAHLRTWGPTGGFYGEMTVYSIPLVAVVRHWGPFDFISFDTEGSSVDLLRHMCILGPRPRCVVLEHDSRIEELESMKTWAQYREVHFNGTNVVLEWVGDK
jgi:FkbM family methyltransferase